MPTASCSRRDLNTAAQQFPDTKFAIVDFPWVALTDKPKNVVGLTFKSEESGYLVGYLAGQLAKKKGGKQVVSAVGGQKIPSVDNWIAGFRAGAKKANPKMTVLIGYSNQFPPSAAPKCKEIALNQIAKGSQAVFQVAGGCGLGALDAAKQKKVWGIGVDADQSYLGTHILTSGVKRVDTAVFTFFSQAKKGTLKTGRDIVFNLKNGGQDVGKISTKCNCAAEVKKMNALKPLIISWQDQDPEQALTGSRIEFHERGAARRPSSFPSLIESRGMADEPPILELRGMTKRFPGIVANDHIDFDLRRGEVHALLGENGAGKSTLMNIVYGLYKQDEGELLIRGKPVSMRSSQDAIEQGIGMVHQHFMLIPVMTVAENIVLANEPRHGGIFLDHARRRRAASRSSRRASTSTSTRTRRSTASASASSSASRS